MRSKFQEKCIKKEKMYQFIFYEKLKSFKNYNDCFVQELSEKSKENTLLISYFPLLRIIFEKMAQGTAIETEKSRKKFNRDLLRASFFISGDKINFPFYATRIRFNFLKVNLFFNTKK